MAINIKELFDNSFLKPNPTDRFFICRIEDNELGHYTFENLLQCILAEIQPGDGGAAPLDIKALTALNLGAEKPDGEWCIAIQSPDSNAPKLITVEQFLECYGGGDTEVSLVFPEGKPGENALLPFVDAGVNGSVSLDALAACINKPVITSVTPQVWCPGESGEVKLRGFCFAPGATVDVLNGIGGGAPVLTITEITSNCITATLDVPQSAGLLDYDFAVTNPSGAAYISPGISVVSAEDKVSDELVIIEKPEEDAMFLFEGGNAASVANVRNCFEKMVIKSVEPNLVCEGETVDLIVRGSCINSNNIEILMIGGGIPVGGFTVNSISAQSIWGFRANVTIPVGNSFNYLFGIRVIDNDFPDISRWGVCENAVRVLINQSVNVSDEIHLNQVTENNGTFSFSGPRYGSAHSKKGFVKGDFTLKFTAENNPYIKAGLVADRSGNGANSHFPHFLVIGNDIRIYYDDMSWNQWVWRNATGNAGSPDLAMQYDSAAERLDFLVNSVVVYSHFGFYQRTIYPYFGLRRGRVGSPLMTGYIDTL